MDLFEEVEEIMGQGEICDSCLGQIFANRGHGLTNRERGRAWKTVLAMENEKSEERAEKSEKLALGAPVWLLL